MTDERIGQSNEAAQYQRELSALQVKDWKFHDIFSDWNNSFSLAILLKVSLSQF